MTEEIWERLQRQSRSARLQERISVGVSRYGNDGGHFGSGSCRTFQEEGMVMIRIGTRVCVKGCEVAE